MHYDVCHTVIESLSSSFMQQAGATWYRTVPYIEAGAVLNRLALPVGVYPVAHLEFANRHFDILQFGISPLVDTENELLTLKE